MKTQKERNLKELNNAAKGKWRNLQLCRPEQVVSIDFYTEKSIYPKRKLGELEDDWGPELNNMDHWSIVFPGFDRGLANPRCKTKGKFAVIGEEKLLFDTMEECFEWLVDKYDEIPFIDILPRMQEERDTERCFSGKIKNYTVRQAAAGNWCVDVQQYGQEEETYCCFCSEEEALAFICEDNGEIPEEVEGDVDEPNNRDW